MKTDVKTIWKIIRRVAFSLASVAVVVIATLLCIAYCEHKNEYYSDMQLSETVFSHFYYNREEKCIYNCETGSYTIKGLQWVVGASGEDSLTVFCRDGKRGFLNVNTGEVVIPEQYAKAWVFSEGVAAVMKNGKIGFIDSENRTMLPFEYDYAYRNGLPIDYLFHGGYCTMTDARGACGLIDKDGNWVIKPVYDCIWTPHEGKRIVKDGGKYGMLDEDLEFIFPIEYDYIEYSDEKGVLLARNGYKWRSDYDGDVLDPFVCDKIEYIYYASGCESCVAEDYYGDEYRTNELLYALSYYLKYRVYDKWGILRRDNGEVIIPALYTHIDMLSPTLFEVWTGDDGCLLIDSHGNVCGQNFKNGITE